MRLTLCLFVASAMFTLAAAPNQGQAPNPDEQLLRAAGVSTDAAALLDFFVQRSRRQADDARLVEMSRQLADADANVRAKTCADLLACGPSAIPTLRHVLNDLEDPAAAQAAQYCLDWLEGDHRAALPVAAARLLAVRNPDGATSALLAYLPFADDRSVVDGVKAALGTIAQAIVAGKGKPDPALLQALSDPVPLRRAVAVEVLSEGGDPAVLPDIRKILGDPKPQVRLRAALALAKRGDETAIGVLIDLLVELHPAERRQAEETLQQLAGDWAPNPALAGDDDVSRKIRRGAWAAWWQSTDGPTLLAAFRRHSLTPEQLIEVQTLIEQLGDAKFASRERATNALALMGPKVVALLRDAAKSPEPERSQRAASCLKRIEQNEDKHRLPIAAARLLAIRHPPGATEALLAYLPFNDDFAMKTEVGTALKQLAVAAGKPDPALLKALSDTLPIRRIAAAETLAGAGFADSYPSVRRLLGDSDPSVRIRVGVALAMANDKLAIPALIDLVAALPREQTWQAELLLSRLAGLKASPGPFGDDSAQRKQAAAAWQSWWKENSATIDLAGLAKAPGVLGRIVIVERAIAIKAKNAKGPVGADGFQGGGKGVAGAKKGNVAPGQAIGPIGTDRVVEVDKGGNPLWQMENLAAPLDAILLPGNRVLLSEVRASRATERDRKGGILWQAPFDSSPVSMQRLPDGNTFYATQTGGLRELDKNGTVVFARDLDTGMQNNPFQNNAAANNLGQPQFAQIQSFLTSAYKTASGQIICLMSTGTCLRMDAKGKEIHRFKLVQQDPSAAPAGFDLTPKGNILVAERDGVVREYNLEGKVVWQAKIANPSPTQYATRMANGHTLLTSYTLGTVTEMDGDGRAVWQYTSPAGYRPLRAREQ
jgi:HEAT repeat protein